MSEIPRIISVDDHVVEPPDLWTSRLAAGDRERGPRVERDKAKFSFIGGVFSFERGVDDGEWCDFWIYDDLVYPFPKLSAAIGFPDLDNTPVTFDEIRPGCWKQPERLKDMDDNRVDASICFPNVLPRFAGQTFMERDDKELALKCVEAYNDWMIDEWCAGAGTGKLIPLTIVPLWDAELAAAEVRRCADKGSHAVAFTREPVPARSAVGARQQSVLGPVLHRARGDRDHVVHAHRLVVEDAVDLARLAVHRVVDAHVLERDGLDVRLHLLGRARAVPDTASSRTPRARSGWAPYVIERADKLWARAELPTASVRACRIRRAATSRAGSTSASSTTKSGSRTATSWAWSRSPSRSTTRTPTARSRTPRRRRS